MNERIQELLFDARLFAKSSDNKIGTTKEHLSKFAEMIINECMYVGRQSQINNGIVDLDIKEHFGI